MTIKKLIDRYQYSVHSKSQWSESKSRKGFIYILGTEAGLIKIGTTTDLGQRLKKLSVNSPVKLDPLMFWLCFDGSRVEASLHTIFDEDRKHGEWFDLGEPQYNAWKYQLIAQIAIKTSVILPIPIDPSLHYNLQYCHIPSNDPCWDVPGGSHLTGRELYDPELFVDYKYKVAEGTIIFSGLPDNESAEDFMKSYGFYPT